MRMWMLMVGLAVSFIVAPVCFAQGEGVLSDLGFVVSGDLSVYSQYVWRGILLDRDAVLQPGIYVTSPKTKVGKFKVGVWSSHNLEKEDNLQSNEYDYIADYTYDFEKASFSFGHTYYDYPDSDTYSREFYTGVTFSSLYASPSVFFYKDYGKEENGGGNGTYTVLNVGKSFAIKNTPITLDLGGHVGYNYELFIRGKGGDVGLKAGFTVPLAKNLSFSPNTNYSIPFGDLSDKDDGNQKKRFYGGATLTYSF